MKKYEAKQKLIDLCFQLVLVATDKRHEEYFKDLGEDAKAGWVKDKLLESGYYTVAVGSSWGMLKEDRNEEN